MSFRGRGGRSFNSGGRGGVGHNSFGGRGRGSFRGGKGRNFDQGPPDQVIPLGYVDYNVQDDLVCRVELEDVPYFNAPIYLENKEQIGKIDEIFGNIRDYSVTIRLGEDMKANSFKKSQKVCILFTGPKNTTTKKDWVFSSLMSYKRPISSYLSKRNQKLPKILLNSISKDKQTCYILNN